ncbi:MAG: protein kinase domain-containing protein [Acidimicrobiia bacterium]
MADGFDAHTPGPGESSRAAPPLAVGSEFGPYRLEALLGTGGWSAVYRAVDTRTGYHLALKVWSSVRPASDVRARAWALAERAHRLDRLTNVNVHDVGEVNGVPYVAYRTVLAASLADVIEEHGALDPQLALAVVRAVATVLDAAHAHAEWHGKCGPSNVLMDDRDLTRARVFVSDFSVAPDHELDRDPFSAPEFNAGRAFDGRADVYSLAATYFTAVTGVAPVGPAWIDGEYVPWHEGDLPRRLRSFRPDAPMALDALLAAALDARIDQRPRTPAEFVQAVETALVTPDPAVEEPADDDRVAMAAPRFSRATVLAGVGALVVVLGLGGYFLFGSSDDRPVAVTTTTAAPDAAALATQRLRAIAPNGVSCQSVPVGDGVGEVARLQCATPVGALTLAEFVDESTMAQSYGKRTSLLTTNTGGAGTPDEKCAKPGVHAWTTSRDQTKAGEYFCLSGDQTARVDFTGDKAQVWGYVESETAKIGELSQWFLESMRPQLERATRPPVPTTSSLKAGKR